MHRDTEKTGRFDAPDLTSNASNSEYTDKSILSREGRSLRFKSELADYLIQSLAESAKDHLVKRCIRKNQRMAPDLLVDSGSAANLWDEICVQFQTDSAFSEMYKDHLLKQLAFLASELPQLDRLCLWLTAYWGECFLESEERQKFDPKTVPISDEHIAKHVLDDMLYEACNYLNQRIRRLTGW